MYDRVLYFWNENTALFIMTSNDIKTIQLIVNSEQATKRLDDLKTKLTDIKRKKDEAFEKGDATASWLRHWFLRHPRSPI